MVIRYIADMHFDHDSIIAYDNRPFDSVQQMNDALSERWNRVVGAEDFTWILGDFCAGDTARWAEHLRRLNGKKGLILGNHDAPASASFALAEGLLEDVAEYREIEDCGRKVILCHYPILSFHNHYFGWRHLYGHVHSSYEWNITENGKRLIRNLYVREDLCRMANVGAMLPYMDYTPRSLEELEAYL